MTFWPILETITSKKTQEKRKKTANREETRKKIYTGLITMAHQFNTEPEMTLPKNGPSTEEIDGAAKDPQGRIVRHCIVQQIQD
jgi:hypothetical protein